MRYIYWGVGVLPVIASLTQIADRLLKTKIKVDERKNEGQSAIDRFIHDQLNSRLGHSFDRQFEDRKQNLMKHWLEVNPGSTKLKFAEFFDARFDLMGMSNIRDPG